MSIANPSLGNLNFKDPIEFKDGSESPLNRLENTKNNNISIKKFKPLHYKSALESTKYKAIAVSIFVEGNAIENKDLVSMVENIGRKSVFQIPKYGNEIVAYISNNYDLEKLNEFEGQYLKAR